MVDRYILSVEIGQYHPVDKRIRRVSAIPVSYTHLTLPTKLEV